MAQPTMTRILLDKGEEMREEYATLLEQRAANKRSLKDLNVQGLLTEEEVVELDELYPEREQKTPEERVADAEAKLAKAREKAEAEAGE